jgi:hypothetical protein
MVYLNPTTLKSVDDYMSQYEVLWNDRFDRLENMLSEMGELNE